MDRKLFTTMVYRDFAEKIIEKKRYDQIWMENIFTQGSRISDELRNFPQKILGLRFAFILRNIKELKSESFIWNNDYNR